MTDENEDGVYHMGVALAAIATTALFAGEVLTPVLSETHDLGAVQLYLCVVLAGAVMAISMFTDRS